MPRCRKPCQQCGERENNADAEHHVNEKRGCKVNRVRRACFFSRTCVPHPRVGKTRDSTLKSSHVQGSCLGSVCLIVTGSYKSPLLLLLPLPQTISRHFLSNLLLPIPTPSPITPPTHRNHGDLYHRLLHTKCKPLRNCTSPWSPHRSLTMSQLLKYMALDQKGNAMAE